MKGKKEKKEKRRVPNLFHDFFFYTKHLSPNPSACTIFSRPRKNMHALFYLSASFALFLLLLPPLLDSSTFPIPSSLQALVFHFLSFLGAALLSIFYHYHSPSAFLFSECHNSQNVAHASSVGKDRGRHTSLKFVHLFFVLVTIL